MLTTFTILTTNIADYVWTERKAEADGSFAKVCLDSFKCWFDSTNWKVRRFKKPLLFIPWRPGRTLLGLTLPFWPVCYTKCRGGVLARKTSITSTVFHYCPRSRWPIQKIMQFSSHLFHLSSVVPFMCFLFSSLPQIFWEKVQFFASEDWMEGSK